MNLSLLLAAVISYPSAPDLWKAGPLTDDILKIPSADVIASDRQLESQARLFRQLRSPFQRSRMAVEFGEAGNPAAFRILLRLLENEKDSFVQDNLLEALLRLQRNGHGVSVDGKVLIRFFRSASPSARSAAALLYLRSGKQPDPAPVLEAFRKESAVLVLNRLLDALRPISSRIAKAQLAGLYEQTPADNIGLRAMAAELLARREEDPDQSELLRKAVRDPNPVIRMQTARGLAANSSGDQLLAAAASDRHSAVRLAAAGMEKPGPARISILKSLLSDSSPSVRAAAAQSIGTAGTTEAAELLTGALTDAEIAVRRAAADALVRMKPAKPIHQRVAEAGDANPAARRQALSFLVRMLDKDHEGTILRWTEESDDPLFLREAAAALGVLDCRRSGAVLIRLSRSKDALIRAAAAESMGKLKLPSTFPVLAGLCRDPRINVAEAAFMAMYRISDRRFVPEFERMTGRFTDDGANCRAIACRALAAFPLKAKVIANLNKLITKACIRIPMTGPMPDSDYARVSALLLLREHARKGDRAALAAYRKNLAFLDQLGAESELKSRDLDEFIRQIKALDSGKSVRPKTVDPQPPVFSTAPFKERK